MQHVEKTNVVESVLARLLASNPIATTPMPGLRWAFGDHRTVAVAEKRVAVLHYGVQAAVETVPLGTTIALTPLHPDSATEYLTVDSTCEYGNSEGIRFAHTDELLFGCIEQNETDSLDHVVFSAYRRLLELCQVRGFPHLSRIWNFFPKINEARDGLERYRRFCVGRYQAFAERQSDFRTLLPAATAVGTTGGPMQVFFLAGTRPSRHIENPRQLSAYHYPAQYGPKSPAFARATLHRTAKTQSLFISGTSSIVGHASQHLGDPHKQALETLRNVESVIEQAGWCEQVHASGTCCTFKVYVRNPEHLPSIRKAFRDHLGMDAPFQYLQGDICRAELLLEVEGILTSVC